MTAASPQRIEWIGALERALAPLVRTATGRRYGLPPLPNADYRALARTAKNDPNARTAFDLFVIELNRDATETVELLSQHPAIEPNADGADKELATFVQMPSKGFRLELRNLARHLTRSAIMRGCRAAVTHLERFLSLSAEGRVPGYEITVFRGLLMEGEVDIAPGLEIVSYTRAAERGLVRNEPPGPTNDMPDYAGMGALVLVREMAWGPLPGSAEDFEKHGQQCSAHVHMVRRAPERGSLRSPHHRDVASNPGAVRAYLRTRVRGFGSQLRPGIIDRIPALRPLVEERPDM